MIGLDLYKRFGGIYMRNRGFIDQKDYIEYQEKTGKGMLRGINHSILANTFLAIGIGAIVVAIIGLIIKLCNVQESGFISKIVIMIGREWINMLMLAGASLAVAGMGFLTCRLKGYYYPMANNALVILTVVISLAFTVKYTQDIFDKFTYWSYGPGLKAKLDMASGTWDSKADLKNLFQNIAMYILNFVMPMVCLQQWRGIVVVQKYLPLKIAVFVVGLPVYLLLSVVFSWCLFKILGLILLVAVLGLLLGMLISAGASLVSVKNAVGMKADYKRGYSSSIEFSNDVEALKHIVNNPLQYDYLTRDAAQKRLDELQ